MQTQINLPAEVQTIAANVSVEKRNEVQEVLNHVFNGVTKMRQQLDGVTVESETDVVNMKLANTIRLGVRQVRLDAEKVFDSKRAEVQAQMLSYKTEDQLWLKAKQTMQILTKEIEEQARWKEETKARFEAEQKEIKIQNRLISCSKYSESVTRQDVENLSDSTFDIFLKGLENDYNARIEAAKKAELERIAAAEKAAQEAKELEEKRQAQIAEAKRLQAEAEAKLKAEREERQRLEAEAAKERQRLQAEAEAKLKAEKEAEELKQAIEAAPDKEKVRNFADFISKIEAPSVSSKKYQAIVKEAIEQLEKVRSYLLQNCK